MPVHEASWLAIDPAPGETLRSALQRVLRDAIIGGSLRAGVRLPSSRELARQLGVSRGVVSDTYGQLEAQGFLIGRTRAVPAVAAVPARSATHTAGHASRRSIRHDLTPTTPDVGLFPFQRWLGALQRAARGAGPTALDYGEPRGHLALREVLADHLGRTRGVIAGPEQIIVTQGTSQGVDVLLRVLRRRGARRVAVEDPSHATQPVRIRAAGLDVVACPVDSEGLVFDAPHADAALVTPAHQFPMGSVLSGERRRRLIDWARQRGRFVIEDDYDSEFRYDREPVRALQGLSPDHVVLVGSVSKTLAPALRLGWMVVPAPLADEAAEVKRLTDDFSPTLDQLALSELVRCGDYDRHVRQARKLYRARRDRFVESLERHLPEVEVQGVAAGMHLVVRLPEGVDDVVMAEAAAERGVLVTPLSAFQLTSTMLSGLVIGYGRVHESVIERAVEDLAAAVRPHMKIRERRSGSAPGCTA